MSDPRGSARLAIDPWARAVPGTRNAADRPAPHAAHPHFGILIAPSSPSPSLRPSPPPPPPFPTPPEPTPPPKPPSCVRGCRSSRADAAGREAAAPKRAPGAIAARCNTRARAIDAPWIVHIAPTLIIGTGALPSNRGAVQRGETLTCPRLLVGGGAFPRAIH